MSVSREEAAMLAPDLANRLWGYPNAEEELVILHNWTEDSDAAWAFTYNTRSYSLTSDVVHSLGVGNGPIVVVKETGEVYTMPPGYNCQVALLTWLNERGRTR